MTKLAATIFKTVNIFFVVLYLSACLIPFLPAGTFWMVAFLGLIFPLLFLVVLAFFIIWLFARSRWCLLSLVALLLSWQQLSAFAGLNLEEDFKLAKNGQTLRVLSWNLSSWGETSKNRNRAARHLMLDVIKDQQADLLCLQEFWDAELESRGISNLRALREMGYPYSYFVNTVVDNFEHKTGVVIASKYPISNPVKYTFGEDDYAEHLICADVEFNHRKYRIFTTHLQSVRFGGRQYSTISKIKHSDKDGLKGTGTILRKLKKAYRFREEQAQLVRQKIEESPYPVIICGDFNDVPNSYTYFTIRGGLRDSFTEKGSGLGRTFQYLFPTLRIDYIFVAKNFEVSQFNRIEVPYSDHYPVVADLRERPRS